MILADVNLQNFSLFDSNGICNCKNSHKAMIIITSLIFMIELDYLTMFNIKVSIILV